MKGILGIDPGSKGFISFLMEDGTREYYAIADGNERDMCDFIRMCKNRCDSIIAIKEEVHALLNSSAKATFSFGRTNGVIEGILIGLQIPYTLIQPKLWQKEIWQNQDMEYVYKENKNGESKKMVNTKATSYNAARRLFPEIDLRKTTKCKNFDDNKVDSILITEYARRKNL